MNEQDARKWLHKAFATGNKILIQKALTRFHNKYGKGRSVENKENVQQGGHTSIYEEAKIIFSGNTEEKGKSTQERLGVS